MMAYLNIASHWRAACAGYQPGAGHPAWPVAAVLAVSWVLSGCASVPSEGSTLASAPQSSVALAEQSPSTARREASASSAAAARMPPGSPVLEQGPLSAIVVQQTQALPVVTLAPPADLWERIRRGFAMPNLQGDLVNDRERWYASRPEYIGRMTERSRKYLFHIVEELELRNMPTELALLPFIESAFNPQAVSTAKAAGMWQFIPSTGKYFDLKQNVFRDDRRDVLASTRAALDYLEKLHGMFGDWHLALAAYNWGEGSVQRALARNRKAGLPLNYADLTMPMETRFYVPKLQAVKNIVAEPDRFGARLPVIENHPYFQTVTIQRDMDVELAARLAEVPLDDFKALNPQLNRPVILAAGTPQILLPWDNAEVFANNLLAHGELRLASWTAWVAPTTMKPADAAQRVGMSEADLRDANQIPPRMLIKAGSTLLVHRSGRHANDVASHLADNGQMALAPEANMRRRVVKAGRADTVAKLARRYGVSAGSVATWNKLSVSANLAPGKAVVLYLPAPKPSQKATHKKAKTPAKAKAKSSPAANARQAAQKVTSPKPVVK